MSQIKTDRELLELAAKAAGMRCIEYTNDYDGSMGLMQCDAVGRHTYTWNPLTDDGDALRLAVKLRLTISCDRFDGSDYMTATPQNTHQGYDCIVDKNPYAATRRAIVRAAAQIGETK